MTARIGVLLSGRGSNFQALAAAMARGEVPAEVVLVLSDQSEAGGLERAVARGIPARALPRADFSSREAHDAAMVEALKQAEVDWVCLAGYMRILSPRFIEAFPERILNIHPSLLPAFPGLQAQRQAFDHGVRVAGCTVHLVDEGLDSGPIVAQSVVEVEGTDSATGLAARILEQEHTLYAMALNRLLTERWTISGRRLVFEEPPVSAAEP